MNEDMRLKALIDEAKDLAKRRGYPRAIHFLDLAAAELEKSQPKADPKARKLWSFERHWNWSWPPERGPEER